MRMLDVASNSGTPAVPLGKAVPNAEVVATDLSPAAVSLVSQYAAAEGVVNVTAQAADAQDLQDFKDNTFDAVNCSYGLMFMPEHQKALQEAYRVLKIGGLYTASVWAPLENFQFGQVSLSMHDLHHMNSCRAAQLQQNMHGLLYEGESLAHAYASILSMIHCNSCNIIRSRTAL